MNVFIVVLLLMPNLLHAVCTDQQQCRNTSAVLCCPSVGCYNNAFQDCCGRAICNHNYEKCCGGLCCNTYSARCLTVKGADGDRQICSSFQWLSPDRAFLVIGIPVAAGIIGLLILGASCFNIHSILTYDRQYITLPTQRAMVVIGLLVALTGFPLLFSPLWYHSLLTIVLGCASAVVACTERRILTCLVWAMQFIAILVYVNPYFTNPFLTYGQQGGIVMGVYRLLIATQVSFTGPEKWACTDFYLNYFRMDASDSAYQNPQVVHYGYCGPEWLTALLVIVVVAFVLDVLLVVLTTARLVRLGLELPWGVTPRVGPGKPLETFPTNYDASVADDWVQYSQ